MVRVDGRVWIRKAGLTPSQVGAMKRALTIKPSRTSEFDTKDPDDVLLFVETDDEIGVPREFFRLNAKQDHDIDVQTTDGWPMLPKALVEGFVGETGGRYAEQNTAVERLVEVLQEGDGFGGALLQAGCAFGKTVVAIRIALALGRRTLVIVNKGFFTRQWTERIKEFAPGAKIGIIQGAKCEFEDVDFAIGMVHSLSSREYDPSMYKAFGLVITDECHRIGAPTWAGVIPEFDAKYRLGLTATPRRKDGVERAFLDHIGGIRYAAKTKSLVPIVKRLRSGFTPRAIHRGKYHVPVKELMTSQVVSQLILDKWRNSMIVDSMLQAIDAGRKLFVVSERLEHLWLIRELLIDRMDASGRTATIDFVTGQRFVLDENGDRTVRTTGKKSGEWKTRAATPDELKAAESAQVMLATKQMIEEGFDVQSIDAEFIVTPISDPEQAVGRARRRCEPEESKCKRLCPWRAGVCEGKPKPIVIDVMDADSELLMRRFKSRERFYRQIGAM